MKIEECREACSKEHQPGLKRIFYSALGSYNKAQVPLDDGRRALKSAETGGGMLPRPTVHVLPLKSLRYESATKQQQQQEQKHAPFLEPRFQKYWRKRFHFFAL